MLRAGSIASAAARCARDLAAASEQPKGGRSRRRCARAAAGLQYAQP